MARSNDSKSLSLRLLRKDRAVDDALRADHGFSEQPCEQGRLFTGQSPRTPPTWLPFVSYFSASKTQLALGNQSCGAVLFVEISYKRQTRTMAVTFGTGHHVLDPDAFERNFGLRAVLNAVSRSSLRSVDVAILDATTFQKRIQASRDADLRGFEIDIDRDLLRLAAGSPRDTTFARSLAGRDALHLSGRVAPGELIEKCRHAMQLYHATDYKKDFAFIDYVTPVRDRLLIEELDAIAFDALSDLVAGRPSDLHIALPDTLSTEATYEIGFFGVGLRPGAKESFAQLTVEDYVAELQAGHFSDLNNMAALKASHEVRVIINGEGDKKQRRKLYDCFVFEAAHGRNTYVLFGGEWFVIDKSFYESVENDFAKLLSNRPIVKSTAAKNERLLIKELDKNARLLNLDQSGVAPAGAPGADFEPCDFLSKGKMFIHLKDGHDSKPISHLWNQAVVSAESFVKDEKFRIDLREEVKKRQKKFKKSGFDILLPDGRSKPKPEEYTVVFGIMRPKYKRSGLVSIPFFSKVSLRPAADRISLMGFGVQVHLIEKL